MNDAPGLRIGNAEREAAMKALEAHLVAGRLELDEYGQRSAKASVARTADELFPLFADLPQPHAAGEVSLRKPAAQVREHSTGPVGGPLFGRLDERLVALSPFVAVALFFLLHSWLVFLLVPISGALVYGNRRSHDHPDGQRRSHEHDERRRERDERRAHRRGER